MGKYSSNSRKQAARPRNTVPPLLRGIGCLTFVVVPLLSYGIADYWIGNGLPGTQFFSTSPSLMSPPKINPLLLKLQGLQPIWSFLQQQDHLGANLVLTIALIMIIGGFMAIVYGYVNAMFGPSRYGPTDVPPPRVKPKKYTR
jgi:hypothetical protein